MATVLVVDDEPDILRVLERILFRAGYRTVSAADGSDALELARADRPDLILTDHDMPRLTGLELCRAIRLDAELQGTPVVVLSGRLLPSDPDVLETGPSAMLAKPFTNHDLVMAIKNILESHGWR
jgi:CheY-like chemotaxis protein